MKQPGDKRFETFYNKHSQKLYYYAENKLKDRDKANIIVNDAFLEKQDDINSKDEVTALKYMYTTVRCRCIDHHRGRKSSKIERIQDEHRFLEQPNFFDDPEIALAETFQRLRKGVDTVLTRRQKEITVAWSEHIGKAKELARRLKIGETTLSNIKRIALDKLKSFMNNKKK